MSVKPPGLLPVGWTAARLQDLGDWTGGGTPSKHKEEFWRSGTIPWVSPKDMKSDYISDSQDKITEAAVSQSAVALIEPGAVLVVVRSGILRHTLPVAVTRIPVTVNQDLKALTPRTGVSANYVGWALRGFGQDVIHRCCKAGTTVQSVEFPAFRDYTIPLPPLPEQRRIVAKVEELFTRLDAGIAALQVVKQQIKRYRQAVLRDAFTGNRSSTRGGFGSLTTY
jgi:type I restriction enzyme S subunit